MKGLYAKYTIVNNETGEEVQNRVFVLKPDTDPAARVALRAYMSATDNRTLAEDIRQMIDYELVPCGCREAFCPHWNGMIEIKRKES